MQIPLSNELFFTKIDYFSQEEVLSIKNIADSLVHGAHAFIKTQDYKPLPFAQSIITDSPQLKVVFYKSDEETVELRQIIGCVTHFSKTLLSKKMLSIFFNSLNTPQIERFLCQFHPKLSQENLKAIQARIKQHQLLTKKTNKDYLIAITSLEPASLCRPRDVSFFRPDFLEDLEEFLEQKNGSCLLIGFCKNNETSLHDVHTNCTDGCYKKDGISELAY